MLWDQIMLPLLWRLMISKNKIKRLRSLKLKKYREQNQKTLLEGVRLIDEAINSNAQIYVVNNDGSVLSELEQQIKLLEQEFEVALKKELYNTAADLDLKLKILKKKLKDDETN